MDLDVPRDAGDLIATTLVIFARHALLFLSVTLLIVAPVELLVTGVWAGGFADGGGADVATAPVVAAAILGVTMPVLVTALHVAIVRDLGEGRVPTVAEALRSAAPRFPRAVAAVVVYTALAIGGTILLILPGIWVAVVGYFAAQVAVMEREGPFGAFQRSSELVEGHWWRTAGTLVLGSVLLAIVFVPLELAIGAVDSGIAWVPLYTLVQGLQMSLTALFGTLMYFSLRARKQAPSGSVPAATYLPPLSPTPAAQPPADR